MIPCYNNVLFEEFLEHTVNIVSSIQGEDVHGDILVFDQHIYNTIISIDLYTIGVINSIHKIDIVLVESLEDMVSLLAEAMTKKNYTISVYSLIQFCHHYQIKGQMLNYVLYLLNKVDSLGVCAILGESDSLESSEVTVPNTGDNEFVAIKKIIDKWTQSPPCTQT